MNKSTLYNKLKHVQAESGVSGMALAVAHGQQPAVTCVSGKDAKGNDLAEDSLFPVASITKLAVALALLRLSDQGLVSVEDPLGKYLPKAAAAQPGVTLKRLLTHSAGLADRPKDAWVWDENLSWATMAQACLKVPLAIPPGTKVSYDGINYGLLGLVIERVTGMSISQVLPRLVFQPLGIEAYLGVEPPRQPAFITDPADSHTGTSVEIWNSPFWRALGEPWSGLVTTPAGTLALLRAYLGYPIGFLRPETIITASQDQTGGLGGGFDWQEFPHCPWGFGPFLYTEGMQHWSYPDAPAGTIGHGGYSGCIVLAYPEREVIWAIHGTLTAADPWWKKAFTEMSAAVLGAD